MKRLLQTALVVGFASLASACYIDFDDDDDVFFGLGDLTVNYTFDGLLCDEIGVDQIRLTLEGQNRGDSFFDTFTCTRFRDGVTIIDLSSDRYSLTIEGLNQNGGVIYSMDRSLTVSVDSGDDNFATVNLFSSTGDLAVSWVFPTGTECAEVTEIVVTLRDPTGAVYDDARYDCTFGGVEYLQLEPGRWTVEMVAVDATDRVIYRLAERVIDVVGRSFSDYNLVLND